MKIRNTLSCIGAAILLALIIVGIVACGLESDNQARQKSQQEAPAMTTATITETAELLPRETIVVK